MSLALSEVSQVQVEGRFTPLSMWTFLPEKIAGGGKEAYNNETIYFREMLAEKTELLHSRKQYV